MTVTVRRRGTRELIARNGSLIEKTSEEVDRRSPGKVWRLLPKKARSMLWRLTAGKTKDAEPLAVLLEQRLVTTAPDGSLALTEFGTRVRACGER